MYRGFLCFRRRVSARESRLSAGEIAAYFAALVAAYFGGYVWGIGVSYIKKLGTSA